MQTLVFAPDGRKKNTAAYSGFSLEVVDLSSRVVASKTKNLR